MLLVLLQVWPNYLCMDNPKRVLFVVTIGSGTKMHLLQMSTKWFNQIMAVKPLL